ncbi:hypothetical protein CAPTEDRAFT_215916 [Capitella teleta]|uniref:CUB domain-containing protein n=1 Tax=Capitella teleta TaxID=283909 RepID=R7V766_CAPTE|nr:hypothetical protein CAPTEDRAFT_215916 [Capitella teleta]|eukprot:ELU14297.1 hypothetical protein CAPTEDRAFT_215916 [Capitella teleta]
METSLYGRMRQGGCIAVDDGIGCHADVTSEMDAKCSGRKSCSLLLPDDALYRHQGNCPQEMERYLQTSYRCVQVSHPLDRCQESLMTSPTGVLVNSHQDSICDWRISVFPGQRINLTLYDFGAALQGYLPQTDGSLCQKYGRVTEMQTKKNFDICSGRQRIRNIFLSETNSITIRTNSANTPGAVQAIFLIAYEVVGCANPVVSPNAWLLRDGMTSTITCNVTGEKHTLVCRGTEWVGKHPQCIEHPDKQDGGRNLWHSLSREWKSPYGVVIIIGLGVALGIVIGALLLFFVLIYFKRRDYRRAGSRMSADEYDSVPPEMTHTLPPGDRTMQLSDNTMHYGYQHTQEGCPDPKVIIRQGTMRSHFEDLGDRDWSERNDYSEHNQCLCDAPDAIPSLKLKSDPKKKKSTFASGVHVYESPK